jgi:hypothetical protein
MSASCCAIRPFSRPTCDQVALEVLGARDRALRDHRNTSRPALARMPLTFRALVSTSRSRRSARFARDASRSPRRFASRARSRSLRGLRTGTSRPRCRTVTTLPCASRSGSRERSAGRSARACGSRPCCRCASASPPADPRSARSGTGRRARASQCAADARRFDRRPGAASDSPGGAAATDPIPENVSGVRIGCSRNDGSGCVKCLDGALRDALAELHGFPAAARMAGDDIDAERPELVRADERRGPERPDVAERVAGELSLRGSPDVKARGRGGEPSGSGHRREPSG